MAPILIYRYVHLAKKEEQFMLEQHPEEYAKFIQGRPRFIPRIADLMDSGSRRLRDIK
jgi:protein-S-isoprenylcysteine O-methyltransferase Ste14